jgi:hypothetical protein
MRRFVNPFEVPGRWYKANLHTHSTVSDGLLSPAERVDQYRQAGYSVLAMTDHRHTQDIRGLGGKGFLVLSGMEVHPVCHSPKGWWHFAAIGIPRELWFPDPPASANDTIAKIHAAGGVAILAHPAWCGQNFADFSHLRGVDAIEVWNSTCDTAGRSSCENEWSDALDHGWRLPAVASDDCHHAYDEDVCEAWTWLKMKSLTTAGVLQAIRVGACYASCGPVIHDFGIASGKIRLRCSPAAQINFVGPPGVGVRRRAEEGKSLASFAVEVSKLPGWPWPYVRAAVTDLRGRKAWANPLYPTLRR